MFRDLLRWVAPGVITVLGGTVAAVATTSPILVQTLSASAGQALENDGFSWAKVQLSGRDALLLGTATTAAERDAALARLAAHMAISSVTESVTLAPLANPYSFDISVENGRILVSGNVPNAVVAAEIKANPGIEKAELSVRSGQPNEAVWRAALDFALGQAALLDSGHLSLSGLELDMSGTASSQRALGQLQLAMATAPAGMTVKSASFLPVHVSPYTWKATFDGSRISVTGHIPEQSLVDRYRLADITAAPVATGLSLASGAPEGFADLSRTLLEQLSQLDFGEATIVDGVSRLSGQPPSFEVAQAVPEALSSGNSIVDLSAPRISDYWLSVTRQETGTLVFDGFVPDEPTRKRFEGIENADISFLKTGAGAPDNYRAAADFGLSLLKHLDEGRFLVRENKLILSGEAASASDYLALRVSLATSVPQGLSVDATALKAARAERYRFAATRQENGNIVLSGMVPDPDVEERLLALAGTRASLALSYASGEPDNFVQSAEKALKFMPLLASGEVIFDGGRWSIKGVAAGDINRGAIDTEFAVQQLAAAGWVLDVPEVAPGPALVDPYTWSAERFVDGSFLFKGHVPADALSKYLAVVAGGRVTDNTLTSAGAPEGFPLKARAAVDALLMLDHGSVAFDGRGWSITGEAPDEAAREASVATLVDAVGADAGSGVTARKAPELGPYLWSAAKDADGRITMTGAVPAESLKRFLAVRAGDGARDDTRVDTAGPEGFVDNAIDAMSILALFSEGEVRFDGTAWFAEGQGRSADAEEVAATLLADRLAGWTLDIAPPPAAIAKANPPLPADGQAVPASDGAEAEPVPQPESPETATVEPEQDPTPPTEDAAAPVTTSDPSPEEPAAPDAEVAAAPPALPIPPAQPARPAALCREAVDALSAQNAILFQSGAALIAAGAAPTLDAFAEALDLCSDAIVHVEGHTDSDGDDQQNLALSVARAEAVVEELLARGISPDRLYAIGYGESKPVADNATANGKRQNRRIVVTVMDEHE